MFNPFEKRCEKIKAKLKGDTSTKEFIPLMYSPIGQYNGSDFHHHYMRKHKSVLNNWNHKVKKLIHSLEQSQYRKKRWKKK